MKGFKDKDLERKTTFLDELLNGKNQTYTVQTHSSIKSTPQFGTGVQPGG